MFQSPIHIVGVAWVEPVSTHSLVFQSPLASSTCPVGLTFEPGTGTRLTCSTPLSSSRRSGKVGGECTAGGSSRQRAQSCHMTPSRKLRGHSCGAPGGVPASRS